MVFRFGRTHRLSQGEKDAREFCGFFFLAIIAIAIPAASIYFEVQNFNIIKVVNEMNEVGITNLNHPNNLEDISNPSKDLKYLIGKPVYISSKNIEGMENISDNDFNINLSNSTLMLRRTFEYCQWSESAITHKCSDDEGDCVTYFYSKGWYPFTIISLLFDQPFTHHNPLREPYSSTTRKVHETKVGNYSITSDIIKNLNGWRKADFSPRDLKYFGESSALKQNNFHYAGNGMFYSPYEEKNSMLFLRMFGQFLEGTLLDWQAGDIIGRMINSCTPGDIRVQYEHISPRSLSVIGKLLDSTGRIGPYVSENGYSFSSIKEGFYTHEELLEKDLSSSNFNVMIGRAMMFMWCFLVLLVCDYSPKDTVKFSFTGIALGLIYWFIVSNLAKI